jgi:hypothetical protein
MESLISQFEQLHISDPDYVPPHESKGHLVWDDELLRRHIGSFVGPSKVTAVDQQGRSIIPKEVLPYLLNVGQAHRDVKVKKREKLKNIDKERRKKKIKGKAASKSKPTKRELEKKAGLKRLW